MPITITFVEKYKDSRALEFTREDVNQTIVGAIHGDFFEEAEQGSGGLYTDDMVMLDYLYALLPPFITMKLYNGLEMILTIASLSVKQENDQQWNFELKYGVPNNGGQTGRGQLGTDDIGDVRPDSGENEGNGWVENFTQLSFNITPTTRKRNWSVGNVACQRNVNIPAGGVPYTAGQPAPMGHTIDGIEGAEVYERQFSFQVTAYFPPERLKYEYVRMLSVMQTTLNLNVWFGFPTGSCMFLEANASGDLYQVVPVTFGFEVRNNFKFSKTEPTRLADPFELDPAQRYDIYYEPDFEDSDINSGWVYVDYTYAPIVDPTAKAVLQKPMFRTIHQNYHYTNFGNFGL